MVPTVGLQLLSPPCTPSILLSQTMPEMTEKAPLKKQHRKKNRETHNAVERHRKKKINAGINRIGELIPCSPALKQSKNMILDQAYKYITEMKKQNDELLLNGGNCEQAEEIKKLRKQLEELQKENGRYIALLKANDICLYDDPTIHWKGNLKNSNVSIVIPNDQAQKKKENLKNTNISVVIPSDQLQKNIIVYSNGSQFGGSSQGAPVQGRSFNLSHNLQKQTANVVPVQRTCSTPATISNIYSTAVKSGVQTSVSSLVSSLPNLDKKTLEQPTSENKQGLSTCTTTASSGNTLQLARMQAEIQSSSQEDNDISKPKNIQENLKLIQKACVPSSPCVPSSVGVDVLHCHLVNIPHEESSRNGPLESYATSAADATCAPSAKQPIDGKPPAEKLFRSPDGLSGSKVPAGGEALKVVTECTPLPATSVEKWTFPSSSGVGIPDTKSMGGLMRITSAGNTQTTWTTLQLAGSTVPPLSHTPSTIMTALLNEPVSSSSIVASCPNKILTNATGLNNPLAADEQTADQMVITMPSYPSLPIQPLLSKAQTRAQMADSLLPLNSATQVMQVSQPISSLANTSPVNQNIVILQTPNANTCPPVLRAELPNQTISQQIVIIQTANPNPLSLFSTPSTVKVSVNGANASNLMQSASGPHMFGGKHLVHILPRPSSSSSSCLTQTFSVAMSNPKLPQTISLNGQLFALKPMKSCSGDSDQTPMQIIQPTTSEDPNTNIALNTFGALANLNQSISQIAGQSCLQVSLNQSTNPKNVSSQTTPINPVQISATIAPSSATENSLLTSTSTSLDVSSQKAASDLGSKWSNKNPSTNKCLVANNNLACEMDPSKEFKKTDSKNVATLPEHSGSDILLENMPVVLQCLALPQGNSRAAPNDVNASHPHSKDRPRAEQDLESTLTPDLNVAVVPRSLSLESSLLGQFEVAAPNSTDCATQSLQICKSQANSTTNSKLTELSKCIPTSPLIAAASDSQVKVSQISETSVSSIGANAERVPRTEVLEICRMEQNCSIVMQASDLLEEQGLTKMFSELNKVGEAQKTFSVQVEHPSFCSQSTKSNISNDNLGRKQEGLLLMNTEEESLAQSNSCTSEQEAVTANRQTDSPMSTSSGSSCGFSVASMLPDACRENVSNSTLVNTHSNCTFSEQTDIVALAARAIFDQETLAKSTGAVSGTSASKDGKVVSLGRDQPFKSHIVKNTNQIETVPNSFSTQNSMQINIDRSAEKNCSVGLEMSDTTLQISTPQPSSTSSLSVNNLIHQTCIIHPPVSCSGIPSPSDQTTVSVTQSMPANSYMTQSPCHSPVLIADYPSEQLSTLQTSTVPGPQMCEPHLKQQRQESRKESAKRSVQDDHLLSTSKRQKQCQPAPLQLEDMSLMNQRASDIEDQNRIRVNQIPPNSSNLAVSVSSQGHTNSQSRLFQATNFVSPTLRQAEVQCNSHSSISDQAGQHLQPVQHSLTQGMAQLQANHPYIKQQQQQAGQLRERHQLYQLQHHISPAENSIHSQAHIVHQQRVLHQEVQLQKKRTLIQATQPITLALQKHHASDQSRSKNSQPHPHHSQIQQMQQQYTSSQPEKNHENPALSRTHSHPRSHPNQDILHQQSSDVGNRQAGSGVSSEHVAGHSQMHRLLTSRALEQQMVSQSSIVTRPDITCLTHRQERNRVSSYSAEALIGKSSSNSDHRLGISIQSLKVSDHLEMRNYADVSRNKDLVIHNTQSCISVDHTVGSDIQRLSECQTFKLNGVNQQTTGNFDVQSSRSSEMSNSLRGMQTQSFRLAQNPGLPIDRQKRLSYQPVQSISSGNPLPPRRDNENTCHQGFMQSLLVPHLGDQANGSQRPVSEHQRNPQCVSSSNVDYNCTPTRESIHIRREGDDQNRESCDMSLGTLNTRNNSLNIPFSSSSGDIQGRNSSPNISIQKSNPMRITESHGTKAHINPSASTNVHGAVRPLHYAPVSRSNVDQVPPSVRHTNSSASDRSRHPVQDNSSSKIRQPERNRSANQRHGNVFDSSFPLSTSGGMTLGRQQAAIEKRGNTVRFMPEGSQVSNDSTAADQHSLSQNFGFSFIPESGMNPPVNANTSFIPPVTQSNATRTTALIPVDPQNTLPSFYPPYSPAHPTLSNDISIPYFSNQMFSNPGTEKPNGGGLNNRFGSILSPPRPVGFAQPSFPLLTDMPPMHMANSSHLSNFNLTSLFPEIATALPSDGSAISPLLSIANTSAADSSKQSSNRPAHNISHILGHDCSSAV